MNQFMHMAKDNKNGNIDPKDGTLVYYVVDHGWYKHWVEFIKGKREIPREIENKNIKSFIQTERSRKGTRTESDNELGLREGEDYMLLC